MLYNQNIVLIEGRLTKKPELCVTKTGKEYSHFSVCFNNVVKRKEANEKGYFYDFVPNFFNLTAWNKTAVKAAEFNKGDDVSVYGKLCYEEWTDANNNRKNKVYILVTSIKKLLDEKKRNVFSLSAQTESNDKENSQEFTSDIPF